MSNEIFQHRFLFSLFENFTVWFFEMKKISIKSYGNSLINASTNSYV